MLRHIVMWKLNEGVDAAKVKADIKLELEALVNIIDELKYAEVISQVEAGSTHDIALISEVENIDALKRYANHEAHIRVAENYIKPFVHDRVCIDYYIG